ncbi:hypothetical protein K373_05489 [Streptomyces sp. DvalAA-21]|nr:MULTISPECIES: hypothetical protein [unclassified Streptomyces]AEN14141.1 hypothetical protein SACTE_6371 [Streptomyces sp. SirexAA-E]PZX33216.1 hypothetical protein K373_05489 [Streptomyces sp. DvalAA-21]RAJ27341.1 hypothetical protein K351_05938 [Streptomyces sp. DpondAA-E10]RAJ41591.1 hypothetical protein K352_05929 [Streptomyces sp. DpondAA-A50]SCE45470.1 hypothetical protein GA0115235_1199156 [Streptomyces sp. DpondAA-F4a]SCL99252.1 hypothetical protein SAMN04883147_1051155 [Streptomyc
MFRHRRVRVVTVLLIGWVVLASVEHRAEQAPWPRAVPAGLLWACVVAGVWWFAEWTQAPVRTARRARRGAPGDGARRRHGAVEDPDPHPHPRNSSTPSHR